MMTRTFLANSSDRSIVKEFFNQYAQRVNEWSKIAKVRTLKEGKDIKISEMAGFGNLRPKSEGAPMTLDQFAQGHSMTITPTAFALAGQITYEAKADDIQGNVSKALQRLAANASQIYDIEFMKFMANTFGTSLCWDGNAVCYDTHTTLRGGTTLDNLTTAALGPTSFQSAIDYFVNMVGADDMPVILPPKTLLVARKNSQIAWELQTATGRVWDYVAGARDKGYINDGSANQMPAAVADKNRFNPSNSYVTAWDIQENHFYAAAGADDDDWWLFGEDPDMTGIQCVVRDPVQVGKFTDELTKSEVVTSYTRFCYALPNPCTVYGGNIA